ncbi:MAG: hypothetical protein ACRDHP_10885 [Ktedonobacterales bacterium]
MLSERLQAVINSAAQLPADIQDQVAAQLESAITNALWDADLRDPQNDAWLTEWIAEARQDETVDFPLPSAVETAGKADSDV